MADFLHSEAHDMAPALRRRFVDRLLVAFPSASARLDVIEPLVRIEWILIVLNVLELGRARPPQVVAARVALAERLLERAT
jgi:hypothetical protein